MISQYCWNYLPILPVHKYAWLGMNTSNAMDYIWVEFAIQNLEITNNVSRGGSFCASIIFESGTVLKTKKKQRTPLTCHHSINDRCISLLAIPEDWDGVNVFHAWSQARHYDASWLWSHFSWCFPSLAWSYTQLEEGKQNKHQGQIFPELGYCRGCGSTS